MRAREKQWVSAQVAAGMLDLTSAEVCRLLSIGRLSGTKCKQPGRGGKAQWLVDPKSIAKEQKFLAQRAAEVRRRKEAKTGA